MVQTDQISVDKTNTPLWRKTTLILLLILLLAGFLRLFKLGQSPPGLNQDEAANAWNAYCLLKTGHDQTGVSWPIFYTRGLGGNSSTLFMYFMIPFQTLGGLGIYTTRLPGAVSGILTVLLIYFAGECLFDRNVGLMAAFLLALNPWHIQQSRWGHEASISPLLVILPLVVMLWANLPLSDRKTTSPRPILAFLAGALAAIGCYGYHSIRIFTPVLLFFIIVLTITHWWNFIKSRRGLITVIMLFLGFIIFFGPLAWQHIFHPEGISRHSIEHGKAGISFLDAPFGIAVKNIFSRYIHHFGPDFLFIRGDHRIMQSPPQSGQFHWYMLPLMLIGLVFILKFFKSSVSVRTLLALVIVYPVGDSLFAMEGMHSLRSLPGLCGLILLSAFGAVYSLRWLWNRTHSYVGGIIAVSIIIVVISNVQYLYRFYIDYDRIPEVYSLYHTDFIEACEWLNPRIDEAEAVFCTTRELNMPYILALVALDYDPHQWFEDPRRFETVGEWDYYSRFGKMYFIYDSSDLQILSQLEQKTHRGPIYLIMRPNDLMSSTPVHRIISPQGSDALWIYVF